MDLLFERKWCIPAYKFMLNNSLLVFRFSSQNGFDSYSKPFFFNLQQIFTFLRVTPSPSPFLLLFAVWWNCFMKNMIFKLLSCIIHIYSFSPHLQLDKFSCTFLNAHPQTSPSIFEPSLFFPSALQFRPVSFRLLSFLFGSCLFS